MAFTGAGTTPRCSRTSSRSWTGPDHGPSSSTTATSPAPRSAIWSCSDPARAPPTSPSIALIKVAFRAYAVRPDQRRQRREPVSRTTSTSGSRTPSELQETRNASDPPLPAGLHHRHADGRADGAAGCSSRPASRRWTRTSASPRRTTTRSRPTRRRRPGMSYYLNRLGAGHGLLHALRQRPVGEPERGEPASGAARAPTRACSGRSRAPRPTTRSSCSPSRTRRSPAPSCAWRTRPAR